MELQTTLRRYIGSNHEFNFSADMKYLQAYSYNWWRFLYKDEIGNIIFNDSRYSNSTSNHQSNVRYKLRSLNLLPNLIVYNTTDNLRSADSLIRENIYSLKDQIKELKDAIAKKGSWRKTNIAREKAIKQLNFEINDYEFFLNNHLDKKIFNPKLCDWEKDRLKTFRLHKRFAEYFLKPNKVLKTNEFNDFKKRYCLLNRSHSCPYGLSLLKPFINLNDINNITEILLYPHINDLLRMIPDIDSKEYKLFLSWTKKTGLHDYCTILKLDFIHTYQINRQNRINNPRSKNPKKVSEIIKFNVDPKLLEIQNKDLKIIKSDRELRGEGRRQSHCIGGDYYINKMRQGHQALNFKGYTFYLDPNLNILETSGRHNCYTPDEIKKELIELIAS